MSQQAFADQFELTRTSVGSYEEGRAEPKIDTIIQIAKLFGISIDVLLTKELTVNELYNFDVFKTELNEPLIGKTEKKEPGDNIAFVSIANHAEYTIKCNSRSFVETLPEIKLPIKSASNHRAFEVTDNQMQLDNHGLFQGDLAIGKRATLDNLKKLHNEAIYIIVTEGGVIESRLKHVGKRLAFKPDNPGFEALEIPPDSILELWEVVACFTTHISPPTTLEDKVLMLEREIEALKAAVFK